MTAVTRIIVAIAGIGLVLVPASAAGQEIHGGVQGGLTVSSLSNLSKAIDFGGPVDIKTRKGVVIGPFVAFPITGAAALQIEALYATKGATPTDGTNEIRIRLAYLDVPVLLRLAPPSAKGLYFLFGPSLNVNLTAETVDVVPSAVTEDVKDEIRNTEFGLVVGAGVAIQKFLVEGRYSAGLTDIADTPRLAAPVKNRAFAILVGARF